MKQVDDMGYLKHISVKGFKSINQTTDFKLGMLNILIGANGAGKSNFIQVFDFIRQIIHKNLQFYTGQSAGADTILHFGRKVTKKLSISLEFEVTDELTNGYEFTLVPTTEDSLLFESERVSFHNHKEHPKPYDRNLESEGKKETQLLNSTGKKSTEGYVLEYIKSCLVYHFHDTGKDSRVKTTHRLDDNRFLYTDASNLAAFLYKLKEYSPDHYQNIAETIRLASPFFHDFVLEPIHFPDSEPTIRLEWKARNSDKIFNAHSLSDGTLRFICLTTLLCQPNMPETILLDEPELGLHPFAIQIISDLLKSASKESQIVVSTQSVTLVNHFEPDDLIIVEQENNASVFKRPSQKEVSSWMDDYALGDIWEKNIIGGRP